MVKFVTSMPLSQKEALDREAEELGISIAELLRSIIREHQKGRGKTSESPPS